jgi:RNA polymerase sigma-70 factor, ECF subfamily
LASEDLPDEALMRRYQAGDASAFAVLMRRHLGRLYNFVARHTGNRAVAEDLSQEVFLRVVERAGDFKHEARFTTWLYTIARNQCIDHLRKASLRRHPSLDDGGPGEDRLPLKERLENQSVGISGERVAMDNEVKDRILAGLAKLPEEQREVFLLREISNLPFQEIAAVTGVPENTVKSRMRYALERLREGMADYGTHDDADDATSPEDDEDALTGATATDPRERARQKAR